MDTYLLKDKRVLTHDSATRFKGFITTSQLVANNISDQLQFARLISTPARTPTAAIRDHS